MIPARADTRDKHDPSLASPPTKPTSSRPFHNQRTFRSTSISPNQPRNPRPPMSRATRSAHGAHPRLQEAHAHRHSPRRPLHHLLLPPAAPHLRHRLGSRRLRRSAHRLRSIRTHRTPRMSADAGPCPSAADAAFGNPRADAHAITRRVQGSSRPLGHGDQPPPATNLAARRRLRPHHLQLRRVPREAPEHPPQRRARGPRGDMPRIAPLGFDRLSNARAHWLARRPRQ